MTHPVLQKYEYLKPITDDDTVHRMLAELIKKPQDQRTDFFAQSRLGGGFYLYENDAFFGKVVEYVPGHKGDDSVTTLYEGHKIFESRQGLLNAREEIISAIDRILMALPNTTVVRDDGRERDVYLNELGTAQLLDVLARFSQTSPLIIGA